jgi:hypothetical protein
MSSRDPLDKRMAHLDSVLRSTGADRYDLGYHAALEDMRRWVDEDEKDADLLLHEVECYLDSADNWPIDEDETELDALHRRLAAWEETECDDPDRTVTAWRYMGILSAASALAEQGVSLPDRWLSDQIVAVHEMIGDESCSGCSEWFVSGECIPCETCDGIFCPACESKPCAGTTGTEHEVAR